MSMEESNAGREMVTFARRAEDMENNAMTRISKKEKSKSVSGETELKEMVTLVDKADKKSVAVKRISASKAAVVRNEPKDNSLVEDTAVYPKGNDNNCEVTMSNLQKNTMLHPNILQTVPKQPQMVQPRSRLNPIPQTNAAIQVERLIEGKNSRYICEVSINGGYPVCKVVPVNKFTDGKWLKEIPCFGVIGGRKGNELVKEYLNQLVMVFNGERINEIDKPGWIPWKRTWCYVTPRGIVGNHSEVVLSMYGQDFGEKNHNAHIGHLREFLEMECLSTCNPAAIIICLYVVLSFLHTLFKEAGVPVKFLLFIHGKGGSMKTSLALAMTQIENRKTPKYTLKSTSAGLETGFRDYKDAVMLIDDLAPTQDLSEQRVLEHNLELMIRSFGDGTGRKRSNDYLKADKAGQYEAEGGAIITGEYVTGVVSSLARSLFLPLRRSDVDTILLTMIQEDESRLSRFMFHFLSYIGQNSYRYIQFIARQCKIYRKNKQGQYSNQRYAEYYADLKTASDVLLQYGMETHQLNGEQFKSYDSKHEAAISAVINANSRNLSAESPIVQLCNAITEAISSGKYLIRSIGNTCGMLDRTILEDSLFYYVPQPFLKRMKEEYDKENGYRSARTASTSKYISRLLAEHDVIVPVQEGKDLRYSKKLTGYGNIRYVLMKKDKLQECTML